jgi:hypothetical protein
MTRRYAESTSVSEEKSRAEIQATLKRYGATAFGYAEEGWRAMISFKADDRYVRIVLPLPQPRTTRDQGKSWEASHERQTRQAWRALALVVKAKLEAIAAGIATFEDEFMAHIVMPDGKTFREHASPAIQQAYLTGEMPSLVPALTGGKE